MENLAPNCGLVLPVVYQCKQSQTLKIIKNISQQSVDDLCHFKGQTSS